MDSGRAAFGAMNVAQMTATTAGAPIPSTHAADVEILPGRSS